LNKKRSLPKVTIAFSFSPHRLPVAEERLQGIINIALLPDHILVRQPWPANGETYVERSEEEDEYPSESHIKNEEQVSIFDVDFFDYLGDIESDSLVFIERDLKTSKTFFIKSKKAAKRSVKLTDGFWIR
jgi:transcription antitermination factor NusG